MNRLWVRISLAITGILMMGVILLMSTMFILRHTGILSPAPEETPLFSPAVAALREAGIIAPDVSDGEIKDAFRVAMDLFCQCAGQPSGCLFYNKIHQQFPNFRPG